MEKVALMKKDFLFGAKSGFSFFEIIIAVALMAVALTIVIPNTMGRRVVQERTGFVAELNAVMNEVWLRGLQQGKIHKINFNLEKRVITVAEQTDKFDVDKKIVFDPIKLHFASNSYVWPESFDVQQLYVQRVDEIAAGGALRKTEDIWFFMMPDGMCQEVIINISDNPSSAPEKDAKYFSVVINPFTAQCVMYDTFQKPLS